MNISGLKRQPYLGLVALTRYELMQGSPFWRERTPSQTNQFVPLTKIYFASTEYSTTKPDHGRDNLYERWKELNDESATKFYPFPDFPGHM